ncbi:MAG TPA: Rad52/Rad22 family DNA repair protein [Polyangiaceae bacterium]|nr:Rad52/Rad22 family DNA repair protein [Polyangiaceae bacterium]
MNKTLLTQPFAPEFIKQRPGSHGKTVNYVDVASVVTRLNEGCDVWDFFIDKYEVHEEEVLVQGRLVADGVTKCAFGGSSVTVDKQGRVVSIPDDLKSAASDALKKCASLLGVGLELYGGQAGTTRTSSTPQRATATSRSPVRTGGPARSTTSQPVVPTSTSATSTTPTTGAPSPPPATTTRATSRLSVPAEDPNERATVRQLAAIHSASRRRGYNRESLALFVGETTGKKDLSHLTRDEASRVIDGLNQVSRAH